MPRLLTVAIESKAGRVALRVRRWHLPESPYPVPVYAGEHRTVEAWDSTPRQLRGIAAALLEAAERLEAEKS